MEGILAFGKGDVKSQRDYRKEGQNSIRKDKVPTGHSNGKPILEVPRGCMVGLHRHLHTSLHHWDQFPT